MTLLLLFIFGGLLTVVGWKLVPRRTSEPAAPATTQQAIDRGNLQKRTRELAQEVAAFLEQRDGVLPQLYSQLKPGTNRWPTYKTWQDGVIGGYRWLFEKRVIAIRNECATFHIVDQKLDDALAMPLVSDFQVREIAKRLVALADDIKPEVSESTPTIERKGTRGIRLPLDPETYRITSSHYQGEKNNLIALLAKFYYLPEPNTPDWVYVSAYIAFYPGYKSYEAFRPVWFETESNKQIFKRADTHELIIVLGGAPAYLAGHQRWASYESSDKEGYFHYEGVFDEGFRAQVELIVERDQFVAKQVFHYEIKAKVTPNAETRLLEI